MLKDKVDIQNLKDDRNITIDKVGVKNVRYPIVVEDRENKTQNTIANIDIFVELLHKHRGTHMSRFIKVLNEFHQENLVDNLENFLTEIKQELFADYAYTRLKFPYFIQKEAPVSKIKSYMSYDCFFEANLKDKFNLTIGVIVPITSLCPCSKEISDFGAHNQRSEVIIKVLTKDFIWLEELIEIAENNASSKIYSLLKREDEKYVTEQAYHKPAFVEDIVRDITLDLKNDKRISAFKVESENFESIHNHNAYACVKRGF